MEDGKGKELVGDTPPPVEQNDNKKVSGETEIHKEPSRESEVITLRSYYDIVILCISFFIWY